MNNSSDNSNDNSNHIHRIHFDRFIICPDENDQTAIETAPKMVNLFKQVIENIKNEIAEEIKAITGQFESFYSNDYKGSKCVSKGVSRQTPFYDNILLDYLYLWNIQYLAVIFFIIHWKILHLYITVAINTRIKPPPVKLPTCYLPAL